MFFETRWFLPKSQISFKLEGLHNLGFLTGSYFLTQYSLKLLFIRRILYCTLLYCTVLYKCWRTSKQKNFDNPLWFGVDFDFSLLPWATGFSSFEVNLRQRALESFIFIWVSNWKGRVKNQTPWLSWYTFSTTCLIFFPWESLSYFGNIWWKIWWGHMA